jgi:hypothetical protein
MMCLHCKLVCPQGLDQGLQPQYGALVFNDNIKRHVAERVGAAVQAALPQLSQLNASAVNSTDWQRQLGDGWALASTLLQATPEGRCPPTIIDMWPYLTCILWSHLCCSHAKHSDCRLASALPALQVARVLAWHACTRW